MGQFDQSNKAVALTREDGQLDVCKDLIVPNGIGLLLIRVDSLLGHKLNPLDSNIKIRVALRKHNTFC